MAFSFERIIDVCPAGVCRVTNHRIEALNRACALFLGAEDQNALKGREFSSLFASAHEHGRVLSGLAFGCASDSGASLEANLVGADGKLLRAILRGLCACAERPTEDILVFITPSVGHTSGDTASDPLQMSRDLCRRISFNLNNMLQVVVGNAQLASLNLRMNDPEGAQRNLQRILDGAKVTSDAVKRLQYFARSASHGTDRGGVDLGGVAREAAKICELRLSSHEEPRGTRLMISVKTQPDCRVSGVMEELVDAATALIENASEAMQGRGEVRVGTFTRDDRGILEVEDSGVGISKENLSLIFQPNFSAKGAEDLGLGLASVLGVVRSYGGEVTVDSEPGKGSVFRMELPLTQTEETLAAAPASVGAPSGLQLSVLVIDDLEPVLSVMEECLVGEGHRVFTARSGEEGLKLLKENQADVVISDLAMPGMDGLEVGRRLKEWRLAEHAPKIPFVILTGWSDQARVEEPLLRDAGVDAFLQKPVKPDQLVQLLCRLVGGASLQTDKPL